MTTKRYQQMKNRLAIFLTITIVLAIPSYLPAQDLRLGGFDFTSFSSTKVTEDIVGNPKIELKEYHVFFNLPKELKDNKGFIVNGLDYRLIKSSSSSSPGTGVNLDKLHQVSYRFMWMKNLKNDWSLSTMLLPSLSTTFSTKIEKEDFLISTIISISKKKSEQLSYGFGLLITSQFGSPLPLPSFQLRKKTAQSSFELFLPSVISYQRFINKLSLGVKMSIGGGRFNTTVDLQNSPNFSGLIENIKYSRMTIGPTVNYRLNKMMVFEATGGIALGRKYEFTRSADDSIDYSLDNGPFVQFGISLVPIMK